MFEVLPSETPTPYRFGGLPRGVFKRTWPYCAGCGKPTTALLTFEATPELPMGEFAGLVVMACGSGCNNPLTRSRVASIKTPTAREWKRPLRAAPPGALVLPEGYCSLREAMPVKIRAATCGYFGCRRKHHPVLAYDYAKGKRAIIAMCSLRHPGVWIDDPPLKSGFEPVQAWLDQFKGV
ncbi:MAG TPA: hypothetical protein VLB44_06745 [Kofleriaceae bacterium]|nr:hypothetical protein [Kofleriaceae bacterium]